jgi:uncharacterized protein
MSRETKVGAIVALSGAAIALLLASAPTAAAAASFDCATATLPHDKLICASPTLSAADEDMTAAYQEARSMLSDDGKQLLLESQRSWLGYLRAFCLLDQRCLESAYHERINTLRNEAVVRVGPFRFQSVDSYDVEKLDEKPGKSAAPRLTSIVVSYPRIDDPVTPDATRWNELVRRRVDAFVDRDNLKGKEIASTTKHAILHASHDVVSLAIFGTKHGQGRYSDLDTIGYTVLLRSGRKLETTDLLDAQRPWKDFLAQQVHRALQKEEAEDGGIWKLRPEDGPEIAKAVSDDRHWAVAPDGLLILYRPVDKANVFGPLVQTIAWSVLEPYLVAPPPFPIPPP